MSRATFLAAMFISGLAAGVAHAAGWADYESAFPVFPCNDGWMGCRVDGDVHSPDLENDASGLPTPSSWRVSWFELAPTRAFSPFGGLSEYTGEAPPGMGGDAAADAGGEDPPPAVPSAADREAEEAARRAEEERRAAEEAQQRAAEEAEAAAAAAAEAQQEAQRQAEAARRAEEEAAQASAEEKARLQAEAEAARKAAAEAEAARKAAEEAEAKRQEEARLAAEAAAKKAEEERLAAEAAAKAEADRKAAEEAAAAAAAVAEAGEPAGEAPAAAAGDCSDIVKLEPMAMLGKLDGGQAAACEAELQSADKQTTKDKISRLLMTNAYSKGDKKEWERLVKRHLNEIDRSDPDLCYKYALNLNRKGPGAATGVIRWADVALENRMVWTGDTYVSRVYSLYKLKSGAAQKLWKKAEEVHASSPSDETQGKIDKHRNDTKVFAREWYEYAKTSGKDTTIPLQLCMSAAGTADYCEAG